MKATHLALATLLLLTAACGRNKSEPAAVPHLRYEVVSDYHGRYQNVTAAFLDPLDAFDFRADLAKRDKAYAKKLAIRDVVGDRELGPNDEAAMLRQIEKEDQ